MLWWLTFKLPYTIKLAKSIEDKKERTEQYIRLLNGINENPLPGMYEEFFLEYRSKIENEWVAMGLFLVNRYEQQKEYKKAIHYLKIVLQYEIDDEFFLERYHKLKNLLR
ncbi:hypothetical protein [Oceanobacillus bengalensis]|uniref:hypothetical protein n=1 Tax=Oceanobacillus bengalensis TaxID=1435466 RepID=UPI00363B6386